MHSKAAKEIAVEMKHLEKLVDDGKLPEHVFPRFFYCGHKYLHGVVGDREFRCLSCAVDWSLTWEEVKDGRKISCPNYRSGNAVLVTMNGFRKMARFVHLVAMKKIDYYEKKVC